MILRSARQRQSRLLPLQSHPSRSTSPRPPLLLGCLRLSQTAVRLRPSPVKPRSSSCIPRLVGLLSQVQPLSERPPEGHLLFPIHPLSFLAGLLPPHPFLL